MSKFSSFLVPARFSVVMPLVLVLVVFATGLANGASIQPMAILQGTTVTFAGSGKNVTRKAGENFAVIPAFCLNQKFNPPSPETKFNNFIGKVRLTPTFGTPFELDLSIPTDSTKASLYFKFAGTGSPSELAIVSTRLTKLEFLNTGLAHSGPENEFTQAKAYIPTFEHVTNGVSYEQARDYKERKRVQDAIWRNPFSSRAETNSKGEKTTTFEYLNRNPESFSRQSILNLDSHGDSFLFEMPDENFMIDTGFTLEGLKRIKNRLPQNVKLDIVLTHPDRDHIGNCVRLLNEPGVTVENVIISAWDNLTKTRFDLNEALKGYSLQESSKDSPLSIYTKNGKTVEKLISHPHVDLAKLAPLIQPISDSDLSHLFSSGDSHLIESINKGPEVAVYDYRRTANFRVKVLQMRQPRSSNESSLVTWVEFNKQTSLYTGDINPRVMDAISNQHRTYEQILRNGHVIDLLVLINWAKTRDEGLFRFIQGFARSLSPEEKTKIREKGLLSLPYARTADFERGIREHGADSTEVYAILRETDSYLTKFRIDLNAKFLKWFHHAWLAKNPNGQNSVKTFIDMVDPNVIMFSVGPEEVRGQDLGRVKEFLRGNFPNKNFRLVSTREDGNIVIYALRTESIPVDRKMIRSKTSRRNPHG